MIESMACGTPVIATRHGAVPEVIERRAERDHRRRLRARCPAALEQADELDPRELRGATSEERFAPERMVGDYVRAYEAAIAAE